MLIAPISDSGNKAPNKVTRIAAGIGVSALTAVMLILAFHPYNVTAGVYPVYHTSLGRLATIICNDVHWTGTSRILALKGAQLIAVPTLEMPGIALEEVAQSVLRAVENRVAVVKADVAYAAAIIDPYGNIIALRDASPNGAAFALVADVPLGTATTLYSKLGDWLGWLSLAGFVIFIVLQEKNRRRQKAQS